MKLTLVNFQSEEEITLDSDSPVIIGRGSLLGCFDKKVSRNHGQLELTPDGKVHLIALHSNPCFVMKNGLPPVVPLLKSDEKILNDGDYIGLLPDSFWYKVVVNKNESVNVPSTILNNLKSDSVKTKDCNMAETTTQTISDNNDDDNSKEFRLGKEEEEIQNASVPENDENIPEKMNSNDFLEERLKALEHTKKLPLYMYEIDDFPEESVSTNVNEEPSNVMKEKEEISQQHDIEESEECLNRDSVISSTSEDNAKSHAQFPSHNTEDLNSCAGSVNSSESIKENIPHNSKELNVNEQKDNDNNNKSFNCPDSIKRPLCQYEGNCYRKNSQHKRDYCHPGDSDFVPYENRPVCQYGSSCYRQNKTHHIEYRHPKKKKTRATDSPKGKRRKKEVQYRDTSDEDDYDLEDPFINDGSSDEFIPTDSDSDEETALCTVCSKYRWVNMIKRSDTCWRPLRRR